MAEQEPEVKKPEKTEKKNFEDMTATELREYALKHHPDIAGVHAMKKEDLLKAIYKARGETPPEKKKAPPEKAAVDVSAIKKKIRLLMGEKEKLRQGEGSRKALNHLRRKIKRFKRLTRKAA